MFLIHRLGTTPIPDALNLSNFISSSRLDDPEAAAKVGNVLLYAARELGEDKIYLSFSDIDSVTEEALVALGTPAVEIFLMLDCAGVKTDAINQAIDQAAAKLLTLYEAQQIANQAAATA